MNPESEPKRSWQARPLPAPLALLIALLVMSGIVFLPAEGFSRSGRKAGSSQGKGETGSASGLAASNAPVEGPAARGGSGAETLVRTRVIEYAPKKAGAHRKAGRPTRKGHPKKPAPQPAPGSQKPPAGRPPAGNPRGGGGGGGGGAAPPVGNPLVVFGFNDLGMHCMNQDDSELCLLPPYNNLHAQVIDRRGEDPRIVTSGIQVTYTIPGNSYSVGKTNFWTYVKALFGVDLAPNIGLTGNGLSGFMQPTADGDFVATGIPLTPLTDDGQENAYQLAGIAASAGPPNIATTQAVVPVSWEISCNLCHNTPGLSVASDILTKHDNLHGTNLMNQKPVLCANCHADPALSAAGQPGVSTLSHAMHGAHASRFTPAVLQQVNGIACYACHPGIRTQCQRDIHLAKGITCTACHGDMVAVADPSRTPWVSEPRCDNCHSRPGFTFEQPGKLYKESIGHNGVKCASCHGSPHAITPTVTPADNLQATLIQGYPGTINKCTVCHNRQPDDGFNHTAGGD
jgi:hypothetical protein